MVLAVYISYDSVTDLIRRKEPESSLACTSWRRFLSLSWQFFRALNVKSSPNRGGITSSKT